MPKKFKYWYNLNVKYFISYQYVKCSQFRHNSWFSDIFHTHIEEQGVVDKDKNFAIEPYLILFSILYALVLQYLCQMYAYI